MKPREEAVQGAGMLGLLHVQGAAESDASVRLGVRSHVPGTRRDRAQAEEAALKKLEIRISTTSCCPVSFGQFETNPKGQDGRRLEAGPAGGASVLVIGVLDFEFVSDLVLRISDFLTLNRLRRTSQGNATWLGCWTGGGYVRSVYAPEPLLWACLRARC